MAHHATHNIMHGANAPHRRATREEASHQGGEKPAQLAAKEKKRRGSSASSDAEGKKKGKGKEPIVAVDEKSPARTFVEITLNGNYSEEKITRWNTILSDHEIKTVSQLTQLDSLPSKWDRLGLPVGVEMELRDALRNVLKKADVEEKEEEEVAKSNPAEEVSDEPDWVGQVRDKLLQAQRTAEQDGTLANGATIVLLTVTFWKIHHVDTVTMDAEAEIEFLMWWIDKRLINAGDGGPEDWKPVEGDSFQMKNMWKPDPMVEGLSDPHPIDRHEENFWIWPSWVPYGIVGHTQKWGGRLSIPMDLQNFPFDQQTITVKVFSASYDADSGIIFVPHGHNEPKWNTETQKAIHLIEFAHNGPVKTSAVNEFSDLEGVEKSIVTVAQSIRRHTGFYLAKVVSLIFVIGCAVWVVPILPPEALNDRFTIVVTILLTQIALNFVLAEALPKVPYLTRMDTYLLLNYIFLCMCAIECVVVYLINKNHPNAKSVKYLDYATIAALIVVHVGNTLRFIIQGYLFSHRTPPSAPLPSLTGASGDFKKKTSETTSSTPLAPSASDAVQLKIVNSHE